MLLAALLALGIHALILSIEVGWLKKKSQARPKSHVINMTLAYSRQPDFPRSEQDVKNPLKAVEVTVRPEEKNPSKVTPVHVPSQKTEPLPELKETKILKKSDSLSSVSPEDVLSKSVAKSVDAGESESSAHVVREAIPLYRINPPPQYPALAISRGYQGTVLLEVLVDKNGRVGDLQVFKSSGYPVLDKKALAAVKNWLFEPGMKKNKTVEMWVRVPIRFQLK